jgi:Zn-dependent protease
MSDASATTEYCIFHPGVPTLRACTRCDRPACPDCLMDAAVGSHCVECVGAQVKDMPRVRQTLVADRRELFRPGLVFGLIVVVFAGLCVLAARTPFEGILAGTSSRLAAIGLVLSGWILSLCLHEYAHAAVAYLGGDRTVVEKGYLTLDPRRYTEPLLSVILPVVFLLAGGIGLPGGAVWIETHRIRSRHMRSLVSLAGPLTNVLFGAAIIGLIRLGAFDGVPTLQVALAFLAFLEFATAVLCLLPFPGFDGYHAIEPYLPGSLRAMLAPLATVSVIVVLFLIVTTGFGGAIGDVALRGVTALGVSDLLVAAGRYVSEVRLF